jgi:hypothetical protein
MVWLSLLWFSRRRVTLFISWGPGRFCFNEGFGIWDWASWLLRFGAVVFRYRVFGFTKPCPRTDPGRGGGNGTSRLYVVPGYPAGSQDSIFVLDGGEEEEEGGEEEAVAERQAEPGVERH